ncbi:hypothetical protein A1O3_00668 [Capronia epimyces CBS 606.96]|uniref:CASTOR ACT domain-containing protein n=1 Tax=Capronia epimyces CBS 606.96 TaxID=1182542 RepID=W9YHT6_9EURO|nr:uncharacterized protein A1O3_00668 [Capronia epimyces CBS 606.96]EXJ92118.1 hypothetical protein A1O3_00668 [Capronia epimyces CBS 606.96]
MGSSHRTSEDGRRNHTNSTSQPQEPHLALIHIPIELYSLCLQPILRLLFGEDHDEDAAKIAWTNRHDFLNVSITPVECSIMCSRSLADRLVAPVADVLNKLYAGTDHDSNSNPKTQIQISTEDYIVIQVDGQGLDAGQRVLELTSPLAMAGISIFFITTYFSDYILVPFRQCRTVTKALQQRGFVFSHSADAFVSQLSPSSPSLPQSGRLGPTNSPPLLHTLTPTPTTPPAKDIPELQIRTFTKLKRNNISPLVDDSVRLANCAGSREYNQTSDERLKNDLLQVLLATAPVPLGPSSASAPTTTTPPKGDNDAGLGVGGTTTATTAVTNTLTAAVDLDFGAKFLSLTITSGEPISVLLEHRLLDRLGESLLGAKSEEDALVPITLDLRELPLEATGIVCGVAGRLAQGSAEPDEVGELSPEISPKMLPVAGPGTSSGDVATTSTSAFAGAGTGSSPATGVTASSSLDEPIDISFLSTARAGTVIVRASQLQKALEALDYGMKCVAGGSE